MKKKRYPRDFALPIAQELARYISPVCERAFIAGSLRRGKESVGDIEVLALVPAVREIAQPDMFGNVSVVDCINLLDERIKTLTSGCEWDVGRRNGARQKQLRHTSGLTCDLFVVYDRRGWGWQKILRTGPEEFGKVFVRVAHWRNKHFTEGLLHGHPRTWAGEDGYHPCGLGADCARVIDTPDERSVFDALELPYMQVKHRDAERLKYIYGTVR